MITHNLGYPRIGADRELKKACEKYWAGKITLGELLETGTTERRKNWKQQKDSGIDIIPCNDFSFYDHIQDFSFMVGAIPERYEPLKRILSDMDLYFAMCRGYQKDGYDIIAMEMTKWFDTNYHYLVPEFSKNQVFSLYNKKAVTEFLEQKAFGIENGIPVLPGPITYLLSGKEKEPGFHRLELINNLLPVYFQLIEELIRNGCKYLQLDEPCLVTELDKNTQAVYKIVYEEIRHKFPGLKIVLATYFGTLGDNLTLAANLPVDVLHVDLVSGKDQIIPLLNAIPESLNLSLGLIDGRNIWKNNYNESLSTIHRIAEKTGEDRIWLSPSCSLLHCPYDLDLENNEKSLPTEVKNWMAFSKQKLHELQMLKLLSTSQGKETAGAMRALQINTLHHEERRSSGIINNPVVQKSTREIINKVISRDSEFTRRQSIQSEKYQLPVFPTTTIGSFPQTRETRAKRRDYKKGLLTTDAYESFIKEEIRKAVEWQEEIDLDVLVHGEFERNDMVEYFGQLLDGFAFTEHGWVQSYGSRGVKPPIIFGDVQRRIPITIDWAIYAQSLTKKKLKGMLTGPVTILQWSFVRDDQSPMTTTYQIALALRNEVLELERNGIDMIQIDEPALREGLPLKKSEWKEYLEWAVKAFRICSLGVKDETQIHTHMCYAEFNDIIESIAEMDADVISIETSRSQMELLEAFSEYRYPNQIGPGVYDIHSPRIPTVEEMEVLIEKASRHVEVSRLWVNPDCGLKTRKWEEVKPALVNMVSVAKTLREKMQHNN